MEDGFADNGVFAGRCCVFERLYATGLIALSVLILQ